MKYVFYILLNIFAILSVGHCDTGDVQIPGCGGYVKSPYKLDYDKIEIKL